MACKYDEVVAKLIDEAECQGYWPELINDSEEVLEVEDSTTKAEMVEWATAADEGYIQFSDDLGRKFNVYLVYGNMMEETICDHTDTQDADQICTLVARHFAGR